MCHVGESIALPIAHHKQSRLVLKKIIKWPLITINITKFKKVACFTFWMFCKIKAQLQVMHQTHLEWTFPSIPWWLHHKESFQEHNNVVKTYGSPNQGEWWAYFLAWISWNLDCWKCVRLPLIQSLGQLWPLPILCIIGCDVWQSS